MSEGTRVRGLRQFQGEPATLSCCCNFRTTLNVLESACVSKRWQRVDEGNRRQVYGDEHEILRRDTTGSMRRQVLRSCKSARSRASMGRMGRRFSRNSFEFRNAL